MTIKDRIQVVAKAKGYSIFTLESALGFGNGTIAKWTNRSPTSDKILAVAKLLNVSTDYILGNEDVDPGDVQLLARDGNGKEDEAIKTIVRDSIRSKHSANILVVGRDGASLSKEKTQVFADTLNAAFGDAYIFTVTGG